MWGELATGDIRAYTGAQRRVFNQLVKVQAAQKRLGATARKTHSREMIARYDAQAAAFLKTHMRLKGVTGQLNKAAKASDSLTISWRSFVRLLSVQVFHQAVSAFMRAIRDATTDVIELEKRIAEVQTISQNVPLAFDQWREGLKDVSEAFGLPILDTVEGAYQTLSNQIAEGAKSLEFMSEASQFAVTSVASTADSVNLLTAALNAYNLDIDKTEEVSAKFFKTIELGRVRAAEMANTFGRIAVPANQLTIKIEELQAAIAAATIQGLKYNEAATLIRNVLLKLIRPTDAMKELFAQWGVESGEAAIKTFGFAGVLARIEEHAQGSSTELGELFGRIRAITGAMLFAGRGLDRYNNALAEITNAQESYGRATEIVMQNVGKRLDIEFNKIKNFFTVDIVDKWLRQIDTMFGGFDSITASVKALADTFGQALVAGLMAAGYAIIFVTSNLKTLNTAMHSNIILGLALGAWYAHNAIIRAGEMNAQRIDDITKKNQEDWSKRELKNIDDAYDAKIKSIDDVNKATLKALAKEAEIAKWQLADEKSAYEDFIKLNKRLGKEVTNTLKKNVADLKKEIKALDKLIDTTESKRDLEEFIQQSAIERRLSGVDRPDQLEPTAMRKYDFLNAEIIRQQEVAKRKALKLDEEGFDTAVARVQQLTKQLLAIRDQNEELSSMIHGQTFLNYQTQQLASSRQLMANQAAREKKEAIIQRKELEKMAVQAQRLVDHLSKKSLTDFFKIKDPLMLEAVMNEQVRAVRELLSIQTKLGTDIKDPVTLAKAIAQIQLVAAEQSRRLGILSEQARIALIQKEYEIRMNNERELIKLWEQGIKSTLTEMTEVGRRLMKLGLTLTGAEPTNRAAGGHGIDTQLARISPDEIVMNPAASRKFYSTLTAMNAGVQRFAGGGSPVQYNIGDINLNADTQGGKIDLLSLGKGLRREIRRGRLRLN